MLFLVPTLHALDITVGSSFKITKVVRTGGKIELPAQRNKYYDIRILNKETFDFVQSCTEPCVQPLENIVPIVSEARPAKTREDMWIVPVHFNRAWCITFLAFKRGEDVSIKSPSDFAFLNSALATKTRSLILQAIKENK